MAEAFPLQWPEGWARTPSHKRRRAPYKLSPDAATEHLLRELKLLGAHRSSIVISSNLHLRHDGLPYARQPALQADSGVAVYWSTPAFKDRVIACDRWERAHDNIHAIGLAVSGMRAIERAGATQIMERAFTAFGALPAAAAAPVKRPWWEVLGLKQEALSFATLPMIEAQYRDLAAKAHPDRGGQPGEMVELNRARHEARAHFGVS